MSSSGLALATRCGASSVAGQSFHLKLLYFLYFVAFGISFPFFGIFYKHVLIAPDGQAAVGLIGLIFSAMPLVGLVANIPLGVVADKFNVGRRLITVLCFGAAFFSLLIGLAGEGFAGSWSLEARFVYIFVLLVLLNLCFLPIGPMIDAEALIFLNRHGQGQLYGLYRLWGTYGWSVGAILMGAVLFFLEHYPLIFYGAAVAFCLLGAAGLGWIKGRPPSRSIEIPWEHLKGDRLFGRFLIFVFLVGLVTNTAASYTGYFFDDVMKTPLEIGLIFGGWTVFEIPVLIFSRQLLEGLGNRRLVAAGLLLTGIRLILFSSFTQGTSLVWKGVAALLQGPGFALTHLGIIDFIDRRAHPDMRATYLSLANVARTSLASALGGLLGGWIIEGWGSASLMGFCGAGSFFLVLLSWLLVAGQGADGRGRGR